MSITNTLRQDDDLYSLRKKVANLEKQLELMSQSITTESFSSLQAQIDALVSTSATITELTAVDATVSDLQVNNVNADLINVSKLNMQNVLVRSDSGAPARMLPIGKIIENGGFIFLKGFANAIDPVTQLPVGKFTLTLTLIENNLTVLYEVSNENLLESFMMVQDSVTGDKFIVIGTGSELANYNIQGWYQSIEPVLTDVVLSPADVVETLYVDPTLAKSFVTKNISIESAIIKGLEVQNFAIEGIAKVYGNALTLNSGINRLSYVDSTQQGEIWIQIKNGLNIVAEGKLYASANESALFNFSQIDQYIDFFFLNKYNDGVYLCAQPSASGVGLEISFWMENMFVADPTIPGTLLNEIYRWSPTVGATAWLEHYVIGSINAESLNANQIVGIQLPDPVNPGDIIRSKITMDDASFQTLTVDEIGTENIHQSFNQPVTLAQSGWYQLLDLNVMSQGVVYTKATANNGDVEFDTVQISADQVLDFSRGSIIDQAAIDDDYFYIHLNSTAAYPVSILTAVNGVYAAGSDPTVITNATVTLPVAAKISSFIDKVHVSDYLFSDIALGAPQLRASNSIKTRNVWKCNYDSFNSIDNYPTIDNALNITNQWTIPTAGNFYLIFDKKDLPSGELTLSDTTGTFNYNFKWSNNNDVLTLDVANSTDGLTELVQVGTSCYLKAATIKTYNVTVNATVANSNTPINTPVIPFADTGSAVSPGISYVIGQTTGSLYFGPSGANSFTFIGTVIAQNEIVNGNLTVNGSLLGDFDGIEKTSNKDSVISPTQYWIIDTVINAPGSGYTVGDVVNDANGNEWQVTNVLSGAVVALQLNSNALVNVNPAGTAITTTGGTGAGLTLNITSQQNSGPGRYPTSEAVIDYVANRIIVRVPSQAAFQALVDASNLIPNVTYFYPDSAFTSQIIDDSVTQNNTTWSSVHISAEIADILQEIQALASSGIYIGHNNFGHANPTPTELTAFVISQRPEWTVPQDGSVVINDFDGHEWRFSANVWVDMGFTNVSQFSNIVAGLIKGQTPDNTNAMNTFGTIQSQANGTGRINNLFLTDQVTYDALGVPKPAGVFIIIKETI